MRYHYVDVFGNVATKMEMQWKQRDSYAGFAEHVKKSAASFDAPVSSKNSIHDGTAMAALLGYRIILANIEELLKNPQDEASWC